MKTSDLSIKELAAFIGVSTDTIRGRFARGRSHQHVSGPRCGSICTRSGTRWNAMPSSICGEGRPARRAATASRAQADQPPVGNTGALSTGIVTGGLRIL
jgi:hypothetical protein